MLRRHFMLNSNSGTLYKIYYTSPTAVPFGSCMMTNETFEIGQSGFWFSELGETPFKYVDHIYNSETGEGLWVFQGAPPTVINGISTVSILEWSNSGNTALDTIAPYLYKCVVSPDITTIEFDFPLYGILGSSLLIMYDSQFECPALTNINFNYGILYIDLCTFSDDCLSMSLIISKDIEVVGFGRNPYDTPYICLNSFTVEDGHPVLDSRDDCHALIETSSNTLLQASLATTFIPNTITSIGVAAFAGLNITDIIIPDSVTSIGNYAFSMCKNLVSITIPNSVTYIGNLAFSDCSKLSSIIYNGTIEEWESIDKENAFRDSISVTCTDGTTTT